AEEAMAARDREGHDNAVARFKGLVLVADVDHLAHELVAEDVAFLHRRDVRVVEVQIRAADGGRRDLEDGITRIEYGRIGHVVNPYVFAAIPADGLHALRLPLSSTGEPAGFDRP